MRFPIKKYKNINKFIKDFSFTLKKKFDEIDLNNLNKILNILSKVYRSNNKILICGNGGSAALANHFACDHQKIIFESTNIKPHFHSLCSNNSLITAISNDNGYDKVFSDQIKQIGKKNDLLIVISSSGNSKNILNALKEAKKIKIKTLSLTGFYGGKAKKEADYNIHVNIANYGIVECTHHHIMNIISQFIKMKFLKKNFSKILF